MSGKYNLEELVSIIMPAYNTAKYIGEAIDSVRAQTYPYWELIIVDDGSTDNTQKIVNKYMIKDSRIKYYRFRKNNGAATARNKAIELAKGIYMAFLDSDDLWFPKKLENQIIFMKKNNYHFTCTSYTKVDEDGKTLNQVVTAKGESDYNELLKNCPGNSTVMLDVDYLGKFKIPNIKKRNDYVLWLKVIKKAKVLYGLDKTLGSHRIRHGGVSRNKLSLVRYHWIVYRKIEKLSLIKSINLLLYWISKSVLKKKNTANEIM